MKAEDHFHLKLNESSKYLWDNKERSTTVNITATSHSPQWWKAYKAHTRFI
jgi:hypothetical protein